MAQQIIIEVSELYRDSGTAKLAELQAYTARAVEQAGNGNFVTLTGQGPIWLYLHLAHALHGKVARLSYSSPVTGEITIYDHSPY
ncbi:MAG TPA: CRISPR-associated protein Csx3 [Deltaproteobacteria bacterium]|nr:CRISPR-associated protein Csx3 [Deltaproteobacteria bacterium]HQB37799.1 CRISPR-associated protein Csx3 [Deltaproteobacteria bacterium]